MGELAVAGQLPGAEHEPAPRGAALGRARHRPPRWQHGLLPPRGPQGARGLSGSSNHRPLTGSRQVRRPGGRKEPPLGGDQARDGRHVRGAGAQQRQAGGGRLLGRLVRALQDGRPRDGEARRQVRGRGGRGQGRRRREPAPVAGVRDHEHPDHRMLQARRAAPGRGRLPAARPAGAGVRPHRASRRRPRTSLSRSASIPDPGHRPGSFHVRADQPPASRRCADRSHASARSARTGRSASGENTIQPAPRGEARVSAVRSAALRDRRIQGDLEHVRQQHGERPPAGQVR